MRDNYKFKCRLIEEKDIIEIEEFYKLTGDDFNFSNLINRYSEPKTAYFIAEDENVVSRFKRDVDAACVYANVSTAFTDGAQFGFGAEIGISTQKLHARGPMALPEITTYKYFVSGNGQTRW